MVVVRLLWDWATVRAWVLEGFNDGEMGTVVKFQV